MQNLNIFKIGKSSFKTLTCLSLWRPISLKSLWAILLYNCCTILVILHKFYFSITFLIYLYQNIHNSEMLIENIYWFTTTFLVAFKIAYFNYHRQDVNFLVKLLLEKENLPRNIEEDLIYQQFQIKERLIERIFVIPTLLITTMLLFLPFMSKKPIYLPMKRWKPYAIDSKTIFWTTYIYDNFIGYTFGLTYASLEAISIIFMQLICTNIDIFILRLLKLQNVKQNTVERTVIYQQECNLIKNCVNHHLRIFLMEKTLNKILSPMIFFQFFITVLNLCTSGYCLTKVKLNNASFWFLIILLTCYVSQIFIYCFMGEQLTRKSLFISDEIYKMDWTVLTKQSKEKLILIMIRCSQQMQLTGGSVITLSMETFLKVVKASYSSFNLLKQTK